MKTKVSEATPLQLNWLAAKAEGLVDDPHSGFNVQVPTRLKLPPVCRYYGDAEVGYDTYAPTKDWAQGGLIIERENISLAGKDVLHDCWAAMTALGTHKQEGSTPLIAAMRCYIASKLGDEVEIPEELA